ncbi:MAG: hypothetical protein QOF22_628 [Bradyrhizobium sp.]|jgi:hypothetical protein|nr:hypothetical protein [Bradyrhizobium sp.]
MSAEYALGDAAMAPAAGTTRQVFLTAGTGRGNRAECAFKSYPGSGGHS